MANFNFKETAEKKAAERGGSPLMEGREILKNDMVIAMYPDGVTITAADVYHGVDDKGNSYEMAVYQFAEDASKACKGGKVLAGIFNEWLEAFGGDREAMNAQLREQGGVKVRLSKVFTRNGKTVTNVVVL